MGQPPRATLGKLVTFEQFAGLTTSLRQKTFTAALLILLIAGLAPACVAGWNGEAVGGCRESTAAEQNRLPRLLAKGARKHGTPAVRKKADDRCTRAKNCGAQLRAQASHCGLRSFVQLQLAELRLAPSEPPKPRVHGKVAVQPAVTVPLSSIGSPQSDRGPPSLLES